MFVHALYVHIQPLKNSFTLLYSFLTLWEIRFQWVGWCKSLAFFNDSNHERVSRNNMQRYIQLFCAVLWGRWCRCVCDFWSSSMRSVAMVHTLNTVCSEIYCESIAEIFSHIFYQYVLKLIMFKFFSGYCSYAMCMCVYGRRRYSMGVKMALVSWLNHKAIYAALCSLPPLHSLSLGFF